MQHFRKALILIALATLVSVAWAQVTQERISLRVEMGEFYFQVDGQDRNAPIVLQADQPYELVFVNAGTMKHEVLMGRDVVVEDGVPDGYEVDFLGAVRVDVVGEGWEVKTTGLFELEFEVGTTITIHVTVPQELVGEWEIGCFVPGHYLAGMKAPIRVE